jgi:hypothetical protein
MGRVAGFGRVALIVASFPLAVLAVSPTSALAQAWVPPAGVGSVTVAVQDLDYSGHRLTDGTFYPVGGSAHNLIDIEADYAITDRLSVTAAIPFVFAKYVDPNPLPPFVPFLPVDECRCWQSGWQDFGFAARYNIVNGAFALTPSLSAGVPSHEYNFRGEAALGQQLRELRIAVDAGQRLDIISPRLSVQGRYLYAFVERVLDLPNNRSNASLESEFLITRRLAARLLLSWQRVHGGLRLGSPSGIPFPPPGEVNTPERLSEHDRLLRDNNFRLGAGVVYSMLRMDVFASYVELLRGTDTHGGRGITLGVSWPFELGGPRRNP